MQKITQTFYVVDERERDDVFLIRLYDFKIQVNL